MPVILPDGLRPDVRAALRRLNLAWPADAASLTSAYRRKVKVAHPDRGGSSEEFRKIVDAKELVERVLAGEVPAEEPEPEWYHQADSAFEVWRDGFRRSQRGNLWRKDGDRVLTIFAYRQNKGRYGWCIATDDGPRFSRSKFWTEEQAIESLWTEVEG